MRKTIKMKIYTMALVLIFVMGQILAGTSTMVSAVENDFQVSVQVEGFDKIITTGKSSKSNGFEALKEVLDKNNIPMVSTDGKNGKFIAEIDGIKSGKFGGYDGWLYAISRNNSYENIVSGIDGSTLKSGDKLILYYGDMGTMTANKIDYSTKDANVELTISLNNAYEDWTTKKEIIQPIKGIKAKIDGTEVAVVDNKITLKEGLDAGKHTLELSDFRADGSPKVVYDKIEFTIGKEVTTGVNDNENNASEDVDNTTIAKETSKAINSSVAVVKAKGIDTWSAVSLNKLGEKVDTAFLKESVEDIKTNGVKDLNNTDIEKLIIGLTASGYTPYNVEGHDLVSELLNRDIDTFLINDAVFGIFAYNYANIKGDYKVTKEKLADIIMKSKLSYNADTNKMVGWTYYGDKIDPDMTGAAINALSEFYSTKPEVKEAIDASVNTLSILQNESGYSVSQYGLASETTAFVILGLTSVGINPEGEIFNKAKGDLVSALLSFKAKDGGFKHLVEETKSNYTSTEQVLRALIALKEYKTSGKYDFYSSDINSKELPVFSLADNTTTDTVTSKAEAGKLPQTGSVIDTNILIVLGMLFMVIGVLYTRKIRSEK
ncbi:LPXTG cell wall anchor domain-containing protein [Clostridium sp.]|uniref:LPXTG cell wall anchor domain-containing protein n=1 Tax=Clostridium sp. TaxID=1506 RepID=UPI003D6CB788